MFKKIKKLLSLKKSIEENKIRLENLNSEIEIIKNKKDEEVKRLEKEVHIELDNMKNEKEQSVKDIQKEWDRINFEILKEDAHMRELESLKIEITKAEKKLILRLRKYLNLKLYIRTLSI